MDFLQRVLDSFSRGGVDLFRLRTSVKWASSFAHTIKDIRRLTRRSDILSFSACCLSPIPSGNHSSPAGGTGPPRLLVSCAVLRTGSCEMSRRSESYGLSARNATSRHIPLGNRCAPAGRIHPPAPKVRLSMSRTELDMLVQMDRRDSATLPIPQSSCVSFEQPVRALAKCCRRA